MRNAQFVMVAIALTMFAHTDAIAANTVDTGAVTWSCERDLSVKLNQANGDFRVRMPSEKINTTLYYGSCHSSHCSWQQRRDMTGDRCFNEEGSGDWCITISARYRTQSLQIYSSAHTIVAECIAYKSKDTWNEEPKVEESLAE